jgi:acetylornithine deacetylase/succinyl-diaminopimelate desuccinylase-like protein
LERAVGDAVSSESRASVELEALSVCASGHTPLDGPLATRAVEAANAEMSEAHEPVGVPWGADMHELVRRGIPCVMFGPTGIERAHSVDEWAEVGELVTVSRLIARVLVGVTTPSGCDLRNAGTASVG